MIELLQRIADPAVNGVPGACAGMNVGPLLAAGYVTFGFVPSEPVSDKCAWVKVTDAGMAALSNGE